MARDGSFTIERSDMTDSMNHVPKGAGRTKSGLEPELCPGFYGGYCPRVQDCEYSYRIYPFKMLEAWRRSARVDKQFSGISIGEQRKTFLSEPPTGPNEHPSKQARHDNDHGDFRKIRMLPTTMTCLSTEPDYIPRHPREGSGFSEVMEYNVRSIHYDRVEGLRAMVFQLV